MKQTKQLYIISGILAVVILAGIGSFMLTPKKTAPVSQSVMATPTPKYTVLPQPSVDTSAWTTYTDPILKYSIKYPSEVIVTHVSSMGATFIFKKHQDAPFGYNATLDILDRGGNKKEKDPYKALITECNGRCIPNQVKWVSINNAYGTSMSPKYGGYFTDEKRSGNVIVIDIYNYGYDKNTNQEEITTFQQMISTFQFVR